MPKYAQPSQTTLYAADIYVHIYRQHICTYISAARRLKVLADGLETHPDESVCSYRGAYVYVHILCTMCFEPPWNRISTKIAYLLAVLAGLSSNLLRTPQALLRTPQVLSARGPVQQELVEICFAQSRYLLRICASHRVDSPQGFADLHTVRERMSLRAHVNRSTCVGILEGRTAWRTCDACIYAVFRRTCTF